MGIFFRNKEGVDFLEFFADVFYGQPLIRYFSTVNYWPNVNAFEHRARVILFMKCTLLTLRIRTHLSNVKCVLEREIFFTSNRAAAVKQPNLFRKIS